MGDNGVSLILCMNYLKRLKKWKQNFQIFQVTGKSLWGIFDWLLFKSGIIYITTAVPSLNCLDFSKLGLRSANDSIYLGLGYN